MFFEQVKKPEDLAETHTDMWRTSKTPYRQKPELSNRPKTLELPSSPHCTKEATWKGKAQMYEAKSFLELTMLGQVRQLPYFVYTS